MTDNNNELNSVLTMQNHQSYDPIRKISLISQNDVANWWDKGTRG